MIDTLILFRDNMFRKKFIFTIACLGLLLTVQSFCAVPMNLDRQESTVSTNQINPNTFHAGNLTIRVNPGQSTQIDLNKLVSRRRPIISFKITQFAQGSLMINQRLGTVNYTAPTHSKRDFDSFKYQVMNSHWQWSNEGTITILLYDTEKG